ncbi:CRISPR-associated endonuclease Cas2 [Tepidicella xavieri]|uniref:CRISPR-associated Cas2 family protein n=1 Tax=Tepidicella xavieri TaxID=360241 RepID=A0A4R6UGI8_9BURK|nr:CRISPR-associated endonuclease Cas2 [Tepidicella xavieri]TDQ44379.1 CRISPR-associated Cas2 family protein [Tepidicella xavieri]
MAETGRRAWVAAYDVAEPRRLARVHRMMCRHAVPIEYSVFWLTGTPTARLRCLQEVLTALDNSRDDLRLYAIAARGFRVRLGVPVLPQGIEWSGVPAGWGWDADHDIPLDKSIVGFRGSD